jgi:hypothetical protein
MRLKDGRTPTARESESFRIFLFPVASGDHPGSRPGGRGRVEPEPSGAAAGAGPRPGESWEPSGAHLKAGPGMTVSWISTARRGRSASRPPDGRVAGTVFLKAVGRGSVSGGQGQPGPRPAGRRGATPTEPAGMGPSLGYHQPLLGRSLAGRSAVRIGHLTSFALIVLLN